MRITKKTAILFTAVILVSAVMAVTVFSKPLGIGKEREHARTFVGPVLIGHGFALNGDQYHILNVNAIKTATKTRANLGFAGQAYALNVTGYDNSSLTGDVLTLPPRGTNRTGFTPATVGHISLSISKYEGEMLLTGTLTMNNTNYNVLLMSPSIASGGGEHNFNRTFKPHSFNATFRQRNFNGMFRPHDSKR